MKHIASLTLVSVIVLTVCAGCSGIQYKSYEKIVRDTLTVQDAVNRKVTYDNDLNPASQSLTLRELKRSLVEIDSVVVKDVVASSLIDYDFTVIVEVETDRGKIECYVYSRDVDTIAELKKGTTKISVIGDFSRYFKLLDNSFTKIEILDADIDILD